jgi:hypothetical protein
MEATAAATEAAVRYPWPREEEDEVADEEAMAILEAKSKKNGIIYSKRAKQKKMYTGGKKTQLLLG